MRVGTLHVGKPTSDVLIIHVEIVVFSCLEILFDQ